MCLILGVSLTADAKVLGADSRNQNSRYQKGLLKKISSKFSGIARTPTGSTLGSVDFPIDPEQTVCDPLSGNASSSPEKGLLAKLILKSPAMPEKISSVMDFYNQGDKLSQNIYFADVNVPTRAFTEGFANQNGDVLVDKDGKKLIENFALEYSSVLKLKAGDPEGHYEIASLSDDGARIFIKENNQWNELINNDGVHATRMGCPYRTVSLDKNSEIPVKILYYQGPRYHISNVLLWKHHKKAQVWKKPSNHSFCGVSSNNFFFSSKHNKKTLAMRHLDAQGWKVVAADNYRMPAQQSNPCVEEDLKLSDFVVSSAQAPNATLTWKTNISASSQLKIVNVYTGEEVLTPLDSNLVTDHVANISGLVRGIYYQVQALSVDEKGRVVQSEFINLLP
ncbi:MAG: hypothetical protein HUU57_00765 [Bdellovibrio sp.]|nr:hypothetical protein [Bdellovibrio sp.]